MSVEPVSYENLHVILSIYFNISIISIAYTILSLLKVKRHFIFYVIVLVLIELVIAYFFVKPFFLYEMNGGEEPFTILYTVVMRDSASNPLYFFALLSVIIFLVINYIKKKNSSRRNI